jgi:hypothetical protein
MDPGTLVRLPSNMLSTTRFFADEARTLNNPGLPEMASTSEIFILMYCIVAKVRRKYTF